MSIFTDRSSPLGTIWHAGLVISGRKSNKRKRFEKSLDGIKASALFGHLTDAQEDISLRILSQLLFGFTKIINIQTSSIYQNSIQLLGSIHREMGIQQKGVDLAPTMESVPQTVITLPDNPYFVEYPFDALRTWDVPDETIYDLLASEAQQAGSITLPSVEPKEANASQLSEHNLVGNMNEMNIDDEPGPSSQPHGAGSHSSHGMNDQMVSTNDNDMDDYMNWSTLFSDFALVTPQHRTNRSSTSDGHQRVPVLSGDHEQGQQNRSGTDVGINSPLWDISGLSIPLPPTVPPPTNLLPPSVSWMNQHERPDHNDDPLVPQILTLPVVSPRTDDYPQLVPRMASPASPPSAPRRRRGVIDMDGTTLPAEAFMDTHLIVMAHPHEETAPLPTRSLGLKHLVNNYRAQMQQATISISQSTNFWLRGARIGRYMNDVIEQGRHLEYGRERDPHSQDDFAHSLTSDNSEHHRQSMDRINLGQDHFDFQQMELGDDRQSDHTTTSSTRMQQLQQQLQQGRRTSDGSFGHLLTSSTASDHGRQGTHYFDEPDYNELLEMGVELQVTDLAGQEFYERLQLATREQNDVCTFEMLFPKGSDGSNRSEVAFGFYKVLVCSTLNQVRPEQIKPYGPLYLHLLQDDDD